MRSRYSPQDFNDWVVFLAKQERLNQRDHRQRIKLGINWPYKSVYQVLEENAEKRRGKQSTDYSLLGLDANASTSKRDVRNAYRRMARKAHPDKGGDAEAFKALHTAYRKVLATAKA